MALYKLEDFDPQYHDATENKDIKGLGVYTEGKDERIGTVSDVLVDDNAHFRYLVVDLGFWIFGKKVLLPIGRTRVDINNKRVYAIGLTKPQAEELPEFNERLTLDYDYEEKVRGIYRSPQRQTSAVESSTALETGRPLESSGSVSTMAPPIVNPTLNRDTYSYEHEPNLYNLNESEHQTLKLYEERLIANKNRRKIGEVAIGKHVETDTTRVAIPVEKERVVIERTTPSDAGVTVPANEANFREGEVARIEIHEETPEIHKEAFVREEVTMRKVTDKNTVETQETVRREELDVNAPGIPIEER